MTVALSVQVPVAPAQRLDVLSVLDETVIDELQARILCAEERAAGLECALASNRRIGMAVGILMCQRRLTEEQAIALLKTHSQHCNVKVRELAETVIYTGTL